MNALLAAAHADVSGLLVLLLYVLLAIVVIGAIYWVAGMFLPHPFPVLIALVVAIVILLYLLG